MTKDDALRLKGEAHDWARALVPDIRERVMFEHIRDARLIQLVEEKEREACAKEADKRLHDYTMLTSNPPQSGAAWSIASAIRARGKNEN